MKKFVAVLVCISILFSCSWVYANNEHTFYNVNIDAGNGAIGEKAIVKDDEIYISASSFAKYTRFEFYENSNLFLIKGQDLENAKKRVQIDVDKKEVFVMGVDRYALTNCFVVDGNLYLPLCQMLPILNADIYEVKDNVIYISNNPISMAEVLYGFNVTDYSFDMWEEFGESELLALAMITPAYVLDTVTNVMDHLPGIVFNAGEYNDYTDAFSALLTDDSMYLKALAEDPNAVDSMLEILDPVNSATGDLKSVYDWVETAAESTVSQEYGGKLLTALQETYSSDIFETDSVKQFTDAWQGGEISLGDCIDLANYMYSYATVVDDNREMLNVVYDLDHTVTSSETDRFAAEHVYDLYGEDVLPAMGEEVFKVIAEKTIEDLNPYVLYTETANIAGIVLEAVLPFSYGDIASLPVYSNIVVSSCSGYYRGDVYTDEGVAEQRLSLLLCMMSSKHCYEVMREVYAAYGYDVSYYDGKIENIDEIIMGLYLVADNVEFDSAEHYTEFKESNLEKINDSGILDHLEEYESNVGVLSEYYNTHHSSALVGFFADVTGDCNEELIVVEYENGLLLGFVYSVVDDEVVVLEKKKGGYPHAVGFFSWFIMESDTPGSYYLVDESHWMWQGHGEVDTTVYSLDLSGNRKVVKVVSAEGDPVSDADYDRYVSENRDIISNAYWIFDTYHGLDRWINLDPGKFQVIVQGYIDETELSSVSDGTVDFDDIRKGKYRLINFPESDEKYGYITLYEDGTCYVSTNVDHGSLELVTPVEGFGTFELKDYTDTDPNGMTYRATYLVIYLDEYKLGTTWCNTSSFGGHEFTYEYVGS